MYRVYYRGSAYEDWEPVNSYFCNKDEAHFVAMKWRKRGYITMVWYYAENREPYQLVS